MGMGLEINQLIRSKRRTIALIVERDGSLTVRAPKRTALRDVHSFIREKSDWILRTRARLKSVPQPREKRFVEGEKFFFLGSEYELRLARSGRTALRFDRGFDLRISAQKRGAVHFTRWYKQQAFKIISERVDQFSKRYNFKPGRVKITSARTRWGSCSSNGSLNFSWRLIMAPLDVIDYVVLHELAHLRVKSHSKRFWKVVEEMVPDHKARRKWLREHGESLTL